MVVAVVLLDVAGVGVDVAATSAAAVDVSTMPKSGVPAVSAGPRLFPAAVGSGPGTQSAPKFEDVLGKSGPAGVGPELSAVDLSLDLTKGSVGSKVATVSSPIGVELSDTSLFVPPTSGAPLNPTADTTSGTVSDGTDAVPSKPVGASKPVAAEQVRFTGLSTEAAAGLGLTVFGFSVVDASVDAGRRPVGVPAVVRVTLDYSKFRYLYGANWASRVQLVRLPGCAATSPDDPSCRGQTVVGSHNDVAAGVLTADIEADQPATGAASMATGVGALSAGGSEPTTYGISAGFSSNLGSFTATSLASSAGWSVSENQGSFNWSYQVPVPPTGFGAAPSVSFDYSSMSMDGLSFNENNQGGQLGLGWNLSAGGFIERSYLPCEHDGGGSNDQDLCWVSDNATISLNGRSSELIPESDSSATVSTWRLKDDPGWRVVRQLGYASGPFDDRGEIWLVTTPDGTEYRFGQRFEPGTGAETQAVWYVPVAGNDSGEPCYASFPALCNQAYRWNLDQVRDRNGNVTLYTYQAEFNNYSSYGTTAALVYVRGGVLKEIRYGAQQGAEGNFRNKITFNYQNRCRSANVVDNCILVGTDDPALYFDSPDDLRCDTGPCTKNTPGFWTELEVASIDTSVLESAFFDSVSAWRVVDRVRPVMVLLADPDGVGIQESQYWLQLISRDAGYGSPGALAVPDIEFTPPAVALDQRADGIDILYYRLSQIDDDQGGRTSVTYGQKTTSCIQPDAGWQDNTQDCYPLWTTLAGAAGYGAFNRYYVTSVTQRDLVGGAVPVVTSYEYVGDPIYAHDDNPFIQHHTYSDARGFAETHVLVGPDQNGTYTDTRHLWFRGMGDTVTYNDAAVTTRTDSWWLKGVAYDTQIWNHGTLVMIEEDMSFFTEVPTANFDPARLGQRVDPTSTEHRSLETGGVYLTTRTESVYDVYGNPIQHWDRGEVGANDDRCTSTFYVATTVPLGAWLVNLAWRTITTSGSPDFPGGIAGNCDEAREISATDHFYDNLPAGDSGLTGRETTTSVRPKMSAAWLSTTRTFDSAGRVVSVNGPLTGNDITTVAYDAAGLPATTTDATGHSIQQTIDPGRGTATAVVDHNDGSVYVPPRDGPDKTTSYTYDSRGRLVTVALPGDSTPTVTIAYTTPVDVANQVIAVTSIKRSVKQTATITLDTWTYLDGFGRQRETQTAAPNGGRLISATEYNGLGQAYKSFTNQPSTAAPGSAMATPGAFDSTLYSSETRTQYDSLLRVTETSVWSNNNPVLVGGTTLHTITQYDGHWSTTYAPNGVASQQHFNALGLLDTRLQSNPGIWTGYKTTSYTYNYNRILTKIVDPSFDPITLVYDNLGRQTSSTDRDSGTTTAIYNPDNTVQSTTDALGQTIAHTRDLLGRDVTITNGTGGPTLQSFTYDKAGEAGLLDAATSTYNSYQITIDTLGYDTRNRPTGTTYTIPAITGITAGTGLGGSYTFNNYTYNLADQMTSLTYPALGNLTAETVTTAYNTVGAPVTLTGTSAYVTATSFTARGQLASRTMNTGTYAVTRNYTWDDPTGRLTAMTATQNAVTVQAEAFTYDANGNLIANSHDRTGTTNDHTECFGYDGINRLTRAFTNNTVGAGSNCTAPSAGGPGAYNDTYTLNAIGNLQTGPAGTYTYPTPGTNSTRPHAPTTAGATNFTYRADGSMNTRTLAATTTTYTWTPQHQLAGVTTPTSTNTMIYGPGNQRIITQDATGTHLYLGGLAERHYNTPAATTTNKRYYNIANTVVAVRTRQSTLSTSTVDHLLGDIRGSTALTITQGTNTTQQQWYTPYGAPRGTTTITATNRAYIGQTRDTTTGLNYLTNRYMDPTTGIFLSVDPLVASTGTPYLYAAGNPTTLSDPAGLEPCSWCSSVETRHHGKSQAELTKALEQARQTCALGCGNDPEGYGSVASDDLDYLEGRIKKAPAFNLDWAKCAAGGGLESCGTPELVVDGPSGVVGKGTHSLHQVLWCATRGAYACGGVFANARDAESQAAVWLSSGDYTENETNAMMHAMWFALNRSAASTLEIGESDVRALGIAHESDWRDSYMDSARDLINNEVGIGIGRTTSVGEVPAAIVAALGSGQLSCLTSNGEGIVTCRSG